jgi:hypothetical protein
MSAHRPALETAARLGYAGRGFVYVIVGAFAVLAAMGSGGAKGQKGALQKVLEQPLGEVLLALVALGFLCFSVWRVLQAFLDADHNGREPKALARRAVYGFTAVIYIGLAVGTVSIILGMDGGKGGDSAARDWTAFAMAKPFGRWLVAAVGAVVAGTGIAFALRGCKRDFEPLLSLNATARSWVVPLGRAGFVARGAVFLLIAWFLVRAALHANAREAHGLGGALRALQDEPYGSALLGMAALGLFAFGLFQFATAVYRRIEAPTVREAAQEAEQGARSMVREGR